MRSLRITRGLWLSVKVFVGIGLLTGLLWTGSGAALEWDQPRVIALAAELHSSMGALRADPGVSPEQVTAMQQRRHEAALANLKAAERAVAQLLQLLREGRDRTPTQHVFSQIEETVGQARALAEDSWVTSSAREKAARARAALAQLGEYYKEP